MKTNYWCFPLKEKERKGKEVKTFLRGGPSHLLIYSEGDCPYTVHTALVHSRTDQRERLIKG